MRLAVENVQEPTTYITTREIKEHRGHLTMVVIDWRYEAGELGIASEWPRKVEG